MFYFQLKKKKMRPGFFNIFGRSGKGNQTSFFFRPNVSTDLKSSKPMKLQDSSQALKNIVSRKNDCICTAFVTTNDNST